MKKLDRQTYRATMVHTDTDESSLASSHLTSLWIETPANCVLQCPMCFANTIPLDKPAPQYIRTETYEMIIRDFAKMEDSSRKTLAIPGAGEPFHKYNLELTWKIIKLAAGLEMPLTIFTTAHLMTEKDIKRLKGYKNVLLLVKLNSRNKKIQNSLVFKDPKKPSDPSYFDEREKKLNMLLKAGFNKTSHYEKEKFGLDTRLGIVTSIMYQNIDEVVDLLNWARTENMIFDCDTILPRGRGERFSKTRDILSGQELDKAIRDKIAELQKIDSEYWNSYWPTGGTYVGAKCTRFRNHLYIDVFGKVHPCIGAIDVILGDVSGSYKPGMLKEIWNNPLMKMIREHKYTGTCATCINFIDGNCYSCLGRCTVKDEADKKLNNENLAKYNVVFTRGCLNYRPKILVLIAESSENLSNIFNEKGGLPRGLVESGKLEYLWLPEQDPIEPSTEEVRVWKDSYREQLVGAPWRWDLNKQLNLVPRLLGRSFLPAVSALFNEDYDPHEMLLWVNLVLYDEITRKYFYRIVVREQEDEYNRTVLLSRWAESDDLYNKDEMAEEERNVLYSERILDLSDVLKDSDTGKRFDYRIVFTDKHDPCCIKKIGGVSSLEIFDVSKFIKEKLIAERIDIVRKEALSIIREKWPGKSKPVELLMRKRLIPLKQLSIEKYQTTIGLTEDEEKFVKNIYKRIANCFFTNEDKERIPDIPEQLLKACEKSLQTQENLKVRLANYIVYIGAMHKELAGYEVRHSYLHAESLLNPSSAIIMASRLPRKEMPARKTLTPEQLPDELVAGGGVMMQMLLAPIIRIYEEGIREEKGRLLHLLRHFHHLILSHISDSIRLAFEAGDEERGRDLCNYLRDRGEYLNNLAKGKREKANIEWDIEKKFVNLGLFVGKYISLFSPSGSWQEGLDFWENMFKIESEGEANLFMPKGVIETILENLVDNTLSKGISPLLDEKKKVYYSELVKTVDGELTADANNELTEKSNRLAINEMQKRLRGIIEINIYKSKGTWNIGYKDHGFGFTEDALQNCKRWLEEGPNVAESEKGTGFGFWCIGEAVKFAEGKYVIKEGKGKEENRHNPTFIFSFE